MTKQDKNKEKLLTALRKSLGIITQACDNAGVSRKQYYNYYNDDPEFALKCDEILEVQKDFVESKFLKRIKDEDTRAIIYYLRTKARDRGYSEKTENTNINYDANKIDFKDAEEIKAELKKLREINKE